MDYERQQQPISKMEGDKDGGGFEENNSKDNTPKKDRLEGYSNLNKKLDALDEKSKGRFLEEFKDEDFAKNRDGNKHLGEKKKRPQKTPMLICLQRYFGQYR
jgi:hypothetical protein